MYPFIDVFILAQQQEAPPGWVNLLPLFLIFLIFYFIVIRPVQKRDKQLKQQLDELKKNDKVITQGGIFGVVTNIQENIVTLRIDDSNNVKVKVAKNMIAGVVEKAGQKKEDEPSSSNNPKKGKSKSGNKK